MGKLHVRAMGAQDYSSVRRIDEHTQKAYLGVAWDEMTEEQRDRELKSRRSEYDTNLETGYCFVVTKTGVVVGFVLAHEAAPFHDSVYVRHIAVEPENQGQGIGSMLYAAVVEKARQNGMRRVASLVNPDNPKSLGLHEKVGFKIRDRKEAVLDLE